MKGAQPLSIFTSQGDKTFIPTTLLDTFRAGLRGELWRAGDPAYDQARRIHNGMIDRRPALIVRCAGAADVIAAVRLASDHGLRVSARGGGHGVPGFAVCEGGVMIDLSSMKGIRVNPVEGTARAQPGVTWGEFDHETQAFGLATTGGSARPTGIAGLTLAGGHGFLMRKHGLTCDNLISADVVTADGRMLVASATQNEDLFWGIRGGGGNFGVVTSFEYQLHPVGPMLGGLVIYPLDQAKAVFKGYHAFTETAPDEVGSLAILATLPDGTKAAVLLLGYNGPPEQGERVLRPLRNLGTTIADSVAPLSYTALQSIVEGFNPAGLRNYWKTSYINELPDQGIDLLIERYQSVPSPQSHVVLYTLGGAVKRVADEATAVSYRDTRHIALIVGMWADREADEINLQWIRECHAAVQPFTTTGFYVNYEADAAGDRIRDAYGAGKFQRLAAIKGAYDPSNLFRMNQNIPPARSTH